MRRKSILAPRLRSTNRGESRVQYGNDKVLVAKLAESFGVSRLTRSLGGVNGLESLRDFRYQP